MPSGKWGDEAAGAWGDVVEEEEQVEAGGLPAPRTVGPDDKGIKQVITYEMREGKRTKITRVYQVKKKVFRTHKKIAERRLWEKFGDAAGAGEGAERGITTYTDEEMILDLTPLSEVEKQDEKVDVDAVKSQSVICRLCGGDHWTLKCPFKDQIRERMAEAEGTQSSESSLAQLGSGRSGYVPPHMRAGARREGVSMNNRDDSTTLRVSNLSEDTTDQDLQDLFRRFGAIQRIYLAKDRVTGLARDFAFVSYHRKSDAAAAREACNGMPYDHLILNVEWSQPREPR